MLTKLVLKFFLIASNLILIKGLNETDQQLTQQQDLEQITVTYHELKPITNKVEKFKFKSKSNLNSTLKKVENSFEEEIDLKKISKSEQPDEINKQFSIEKKPAKKFKSPLIKPNNLQTFSQNLEDEIKHFFSSPDLSNFANIVQEKLPLNHQTQEKPTPLLPFSQDSFSPFFEMNEPTGQKEEISSPSPKAPSKQPSSFFPEQTYFSSQISNDMGDYSDLEEKNLEPNYKPQISTPFSIQPYQSTSADISSNNSQSNVFLQTPQSYKNLEPEFVNQEESYPDFDELSFYSASPNYNFDFRHGSQMGFTNIMPPIIIPNGFEFPSLFSKLFSFLFPPYYRNYHQPPLRFHPFSLISRNEPFKFNLLPGYSPIFSLPMMYRRHCKSNCNFRFLSELKQAFKNFFRIHRRHWS